VAALDTLDYDILQHYDVTKALINAARDEGGMALVYCMKGVNRSVALCVAYLVDCLGCSVIDSVERVARVRGRMILTNPEFRRILLDFEKCKNLRLNDV